MWCSVIFFFFFSPLEKLAEAQRRFATLQNELQSSLDAQRESNAPPGLRKRKTMFHLSQEERCKHHNIKDLKLAFSEFYLSLILLQNYQVSARAFSDTPAVTFEKLLGVNECVLDVSCCSLFAAFVWYRCVLTVVSLLLSTEPELHWVP